MRTCKLLEATAAVCLLLAATGCQEPQSSTAMRAVIEAGAAQDEAAASPQGAGLLAEQLEVYFRQNQVLLPVQPQTQAAVDVPAN
jgi:hypothetical protein